MFRTAHDLMTRSNRCPKSTSLRLASLVGTCGLLLLTLASTVQAGNLVTSTTPSTIFIGTGFNDPSGIAFTANSNMRVTELGLYNPAAASGPHPMMLVHIDTQTDDGNSYNGSATVLGVANLDMTGSVTGAYTYAPLGSPAYLVAGQEYVLYAEQDNSNNSQWSLDPVTLDPDFTVLGNGFSQENTKVFGSPNVGDSYPYQTAHYLGGLVYSYGPVDLVFQPVPEPGSAVLLFVGACGLAARAPSGAPTTRSLNESLAI